MSVQWRQGDVFFERVDQIPVQAVARTDRVLFAGERTGHAHVVAPDAPVEVLELEGALFLRAAGAFSVTHEEHGPIGFEPGTYRVWRQREYSPGQLWRSVQD